MSWVWVDCLLTDSEFFVLFAENSQMLLKIYIILILFHVQAVLHLRGFLRLTKPRKQKTMLLEE